jgi:DNA topoisomerase-3
MGAGGKVAFDFGDNGPPPGPPERTAASTAPPVHTQATTPPEWPICPKCARGRIIQGKRGYGCSRYRENCDFVVWQEISGKTLTENQVRTLIKKGRTRIIQGFSSRTGEKFAARLQLDEQGRTVIMMAKPS